MIWLIPKNSLLLFVNLEFTIIKPAWHAARKRARWKLLSSASDCLFYFNYAWFINLKTQSNLHPGTSSYRLRIRYLQRLMVYKTQSIPIRKSQIPLRFAPILQISEAWAFKVYRFQTTDRLRQPHAIIIRGPIAREKEKAKIRKQKIYIYKKKERKTKKIKIKEEPTFTQTGFSPAPAFSPGTCIHKISQCFGWWHILSMHRQWHNVNTRYVRTWKMTHTRGN